MPEEAVLDAPEITPTEVDSSAETISLETPIDTGTDTPIDAPDGSPGSETGEPQGTTAPEAPLIREDKSLSPVMKAQLEKIKAENPKLADQIRQTIFKYDQYSREFPGGIKEVREMRDTLEQFGGADGIREIQGTVDTYKAIDSQFSAADPQFIDQMVEQDQDAFQQLAPGIFDKFSQLNPDGFSAYVARQIITDASQQKVPIALSLLEHFIGLGDAAKAQEQLAKIAGYFNRLEEWSGKPVNGPKKATQPGNEREQSLVARERNQTARDWDSKQSGGAEKLINGEYNRAKAGRTVTSEQHALISETFGARWKAFVNNLPDHTSKVDRYLAANDESGYLRYINSVYTKNIPTVMNKVVNDILKTSGAAPKATPAAAPRSGARPGSGRLAENGTVTLRGPIADPKEFGERVDSRRTTPEMFGKQQAILKDGRRATWTI